MKDCSSLPRSKSCARTCLNQQHSLVFERRLLRTNRPAAHSVTFISSPQRRQRTSRDEANNTIRDWNHQDRTSIEDTPSIHTCYKDRRQQMLLIQSKQYLILKSEWKWIKSFLWQYVRVYFSTQSRKNHRYMKLSYSERDSSCTTSSYKTEVLCPRAHQQTTLWSQSNLICNATASLQLYGGGRHSHSTTIIFKSLFL